ncbi:MAG: arginine--tRNA ligase [Candidatus Nealsonbacteria bacterium]|nr:arginine--tRNA ligase [Candidatus Nealsonbacteria bacterium]
MVKKQIKSALKEAVHALQEEGAFPDFEVPDIEVDVPDQDEYGDYSTNLALQLKDKINKSPVKIAKMIVERLGALPFFKKTETAGPGFINFFLSPEFLVKNLEQIEEKRESYGSADLGQGKTVVIDYSAPNIAKPFGIGHLRSTIIGQAIYNIYSFLGFKSIGDNHLGDWGTQYGKLFYAIQEWGDEEKIKKQPIRELYKLYVKFHKEAETNPDLEEEGRKWFKRLEEGDEEVKKIWEKCVAWSIKEFDQIYKRLGIKMDLTLGESFYQSMLDDIVQEALRKGVAKKSQGALIISFPEDKLPPLMIQKSDGATLYSTRDLATIKYRREKFDPHLIIYEVGVDQRLYFKQLFWAAELLGWGKRGDYVHIAHGMMRLSEGKMSTRRGRTVFLEDVLEEATERAGAIVETKNPNLSSEKKEKIAEVVGIGALKYNDLSRHYSKDVVFDWDEALNLRGNSGPYLQYTYARAWSVLKKSGEDLDGLELGEAQKLTSQEEKILRMLLHFPETVQKAAETFSPNLICNYLFDLAQEFNSFYEKIPVLKAKSKELRRARVVLTLGVSQVIKNGLSLLGIEVLERM